MLTESCVMALLPVVLGFALRSELRPGCALSMRGLGILALVFVGLVVVLIYREVYV